MKHFLAEKVSYPKTIMIKIDYNPYLGGE